MNTITLEQLIKFHKKIINSTGGSDGIRDRTVLESALYKANQTFDGQDLYLGVIKKIAVTAYSLIKNHGFVDGNKRVGVAVLILLLKINGIQVKYTQQELIEIGLGTAEGKLNEEDIESWIMRHQV